MMDYKETVMNEEQLEPIYNKCVEDKHINRFGNEVAETQAEISFRAGQREVVELALQSINAEPEFPGEMPDELWAQLDGNRNNTLLSMRISVRLTKEGITKRLQAKLKEG